MPNKNLTDAEITIKALKEILELVLCEGDLQRASTISHTIDLINRQEAEIEVLRNCVEQNRITRKDGKSPLSLLTADIKAEAYKEFAERLKRKADRLQHISIDGKWAISQYDVDNLLKELVGKNNES